MFPGVCSELTSMRGGSLAEYFEDELSNYLKNPLEFKGSSK